MAEAGQASAAFRSIVGRLAQQTVDEARVSSAACVALAGELIPNERRARKETTHFELPKRIAMSLRVIREAKNIVRTAL